ncbi:pyruvate ferredoxin oxidoreductase [Halodesulfovibrio marinisediminis]|uniref:2-oxoglutarate ferredoxin oxidoreductase subunit alpha n=1 Tax=Halodesulfovibrio marinisediminis DSM 17456 TaxID=1121457 RepID=A0A1N6EDR0_9BACT|nr:pyruvate ferredoxin oxidoreductase [Halodesulfovibrio marinisediminis]SIN81027.1 2-oxoglutarate ferredoxin oxidoreductase subunit alpha [Halodesulfovibrio marinisediminis DSM 17456]
MSQETLFLKNTETFAESLARCGVKYHFAYPITPATDVMKRMAVILPKYGGEMMQMESEIAVSSALAGAACSGTLAATSSSGPGLTLMHEAIGFMSAAELPCILYDSMRVGPGDGDIVGSQSDYTVATRGGAHGDYRIIVLAPSCGQEIADLMPQGVRLAYKYRTPVLFVLDGVSAQMTESATLPEYHDYSAEFDTSEWAITGTKDHPKRAIITGSYSHQDGYDMNERLRAKFEVIKENEQMWEAEQVEDADLVVAAFGIHGRMCQDLISEMRAKGKKVGFIRPITLWPFPNRAFETLPDSVKNILVVEMNHGQMVDDVKLAVNGRIPVHFLGKTGGDLPMNTLAEMIAKVDSILGE